VQCRPATHGGEVYICTLGKQSLNNSCTALLTSSNEACGLSSLVLVIENSLCCIPLNECEYLFVGVVGLLHAKKLNTLGEDIQLQEFKVWPLLWVINKAIFKCPLKQETIDRGSVVEVSGFVISSEEGRGCQHIVGHACKAVDLARLRIVTGARLLVSPPPGEHARLVTARVDVLLVLRAPESSQFHITVLVDQHVFRVEVPVQQRLGMQFLQCREQLKHQKHPVSSAQHPPRKDAQDDITITLTILTINFISVGIPLGLGLAIFVVLVEESVEVRLQVSILCAVEDNDEAVSVGGGGGVDGDHVLMLAEEQVLELVVAVLLRLGIDLIRSFRWRQLLVVHRVDPALLVLEHSLDDIVFVDDEDIAKSSFTGHFHA